MSMRGLRGAHTQNRSAPSAFADMLKAVPGAYVRVGHAGTVPLHNPAYVLDTGILPVGASVMARIVEKRLPV